MSPLIRRRVSVACRAFCQILCMIVLNADYSSGADTPPFSLTEDDSHRWQRGNMHTHSLWSDGDDYPEMIAEWYKQHGYQFLVFTDHNVLLNGERWIDAEKNKGGAEAIRKLREAFPGDWVQTREKDGKTEIRLRTFDDIFQRLAVPQKYLLIQGEEVSDRFEKLPIHLCVTNTQELLLPMKGDSVTETIQRNVDAALAARQRTGVKSLIHLNHPNFGFAVTAEQLMQVDGEQFFEVYNGHPKVYNSGDQEHASTERMWDIINTLRLTQLNLPLMYGLATDDSHNYHELKPETDSRTGRGWVMVLTDTLTPDAIVDSLESGRFYSSSGVFLKEISFKNNTLLVSISPEESESYRIDFIGTRRNFDTTSTPASEDQHKAAGLTRIYSRDIGKVLQSSEGTSAVYQLTGDEVYVRAVITSSKQHENPSEPGEYKRAWIQPVVPAPQQ